MGSFVGHLVPGIIGLLFCMRTLYNVLLRFYHCDKYSRVMAVDSEDAMRYRFRSSLTYKTFFCSNLPLEEFVIIAAAVIGTAAEVISKLHYADPFVSVGGQHLTIFLFFGFAAVISTMKFYGVPVPTDCEYACAALAFGLEGFLLYHHAHGRASLDAMTHMGLVYTTLLTSAGMLCEMKYRHSVLAAISRPYFLAVESTWLCQMAFILFPQFGGTLDNEDPIQIMTVSMLFNWHFAGNIALVGILATIAHLQVRRKTPDQILKHLEKDLCEARRHRKNRNCRRSSEYMVMINEEEKEELSIVSD